MRALPAALLIVLMVFSGCCCMTPKPKPVLDYGPPEDEVYSWRVKFVCSNLHPFANVFHWTDINVLNADKSSTVVVTKKFVEAGTQRKPERRKTKPEDFKLGPNQAANISCDEIQLMLDFPLSTPLEGFVEIESREKLTVTAVYDKCVPQQRTDVFDDSAISAVFVPVDGVAIPLNLRGPAVIKKGEMQIDRTTSRFMQFIEIEAMDLEGEVRTPGGPMKVRLIESPVFQSEGKIIGETDPHSGVPLFLARSDLAVSFDVFLQGRKYSNSNGPMALTAVISSIPPGWPTNTVTPEQQKRIERFAPGWRPPNPPQTSAAAEAVVDDEVICPPVDCAAVNCYNVQGGVQTPIYDEEGKLAGHITKNCHCPNPPPCRKKPKHAKVGCDNASIDVEYIEPVVLKTEKKPVY